MTNPCALKPAAFVSALGPFDRWGSNRGTEAHHVLYLLSLSPPGAVGGVPAPTAVAARAVGVLAAQETIRRPEESRSNIPKGKNIEPKGKNMDA